MTGPVLVQGRRVRPDKVPEKVDNAVAAALPHGSTVLSIQVSGQSAWSQTVRIDVRHGDGSTKAYFMKIESGDGARCMMEGSFESERLLNEYAPDNVPKPIAWGSYESDPDMWFLLCDFRNMLERLPKVKDFVRAVVKIHNDSAGKSPNGKFGFHVTTHLGSIPNDNTWQDCWETWFANAMRRMFDAEEQSRGDSSGQGEFKDLKAKLFSKVIPRLLRPLESNGRKVTPTLIHSNLWPGNALVDAITKDVVMFDSCAYWGHHESDLGSWRARRYRLGDKYMNEYRNQMGESVPLDDWDDRNRLYAIRYDLLVSAMYPNETKYRASAIEEMRYLAKKFPGGFEAYHEAENQPRCS